MSKSYHGISKSQVVPQAESLIAQRGTRIADYAERADYAEGRGDKVTR
jgi:hypothetical protein